MGGGWNFMSSITPMLEAMFNRYDRMGRIVERDAALSPSRNQLAFQQQQQRWEDENRGVREDRNQAKIDRDRQAKADSNAETDRRARIGEAYRQKALLASRGVVAGPGSGAEFAHQSGAQLDAYGTDIGGGYTQGTGEKPPVRYTPGVADDVTSGGAGGVYVTQNASPSMASAPPAQAYNAMLAQGGFGGMSYQPFNTGFMTDFESANIDKEEDEKRRRGF